MSGSDLDVEQGALDNAHACLAAMRVRARQLLDDARAAGGLDPDLEQALIRRVSLLAESPRALCFGRIDEAGTGATWHIGRRHVEDGSADPVVVEWRAPIAAPFYQARPSKPMGLARRRTLLVEGRTVLSLADDRFAEGDGARADGATDDSGLRGREALLAELDRARTGEMLDIVATIQAEQDEVIRAPLQGVMAVQGGPGTGKTAIGLHRAAYLLYSDPDLARSGVLVVGPSRTFLRYIAQVLPSLGEEAVTQVTLADLVPKLRVRATDPPEVQRVKGDERMAEVLGRALAGRQRLPDDDLEVAVGFVRLRLPAEDIAEIVMALASRDAPYQAGRAALRDRLAALGRRAWRSMPSNLGADDPDRHLARAPELKDALDRLWPAVSATELVNDLLSSRDRLARAAGGILTADEQAALLRPVGPSLGRAPWTASELALVDEARELIEGGGRTYGHVVVDEAQDLTPMQLRMVARRAPAGSVTMLGDLAQSTGPWWHESWADIADHLPQPHGSRHETLTLGYRTPGQVLDLASRLLPLAAPAVKATAAVRVGRRPPRIAAVSPADLFATAAAEARTLAAEPYSVGVIVADEHVTPAAAALQASHVEFGTPDQDGLAKAVTLLPAPAAKGLEFDAVVVVEPAAIAGATAAGLRLLYVALTRPLQHLSIVHAQPLPAGLDP
ncbi:MAG: HelD family protein [Acidimicrobiales bacterium]